MKLTVSFIALLLTALPALSAPSSSDSPAETHSRGRLGYVVPNTAPMKEMTSAEWNGLKAKRAHMGLAGSGSNSDPVMSTDDIKWGGLKARDVKPKSASRRLRRNHSARSGHYHAPRSSDPLKPIHLPLRSVRSVVSERDGKDGKIHGAVYLQQHMNRAHRRHAEMRGVQLEEGVLLKRMNDRLVSLGIEVDASKLRKRDLLGDLLGGLNFGSDGKIVPSRNAAANDQASAPAPVAAAAAVEVEAPAPAPAAAAAASSANAESEAAAAAADVNSPMRQAPGGTIAGANNGTVPKGNSTGGGNEGFSQLEFEAAVSGAVTKASAPTASQSIGLDIEANDVGYFAAVQFGSAGTVFQMLMDSGSADTWVPSQVCQTCGDHQQLGSKVSNTFKASRQPFQVTYGTGEVQGAIVQDTMDLAGLKLINHTFGVTTDESEEFSAAGVPFDGLIGLAKGQLSNQGVLTPIEALKKNGLVSAAQVSYKLGRVADGTNDGQITFGGIDTSKFSGSLTMFDNVNTQGFWEGAVGATTINGKDSGLKGKTAILDTGTTLIIMPQADAEAVHKLIPGSKSDGQGGFSIPCTTTASVAFSFGGTSFAIDPRDLAFQPLTNNLQGECASGISAGDIGGPDQWLVGDVFLKSQVFTTIIDTNQMGLAVANVPAA